MASEAADEAAAADAATPDADAVATADAAAKALVAPVVAVEPAAAVAAVAGRPVAMQTNSRAATRPGTRRPGRAEEASAVIIVAWVWSD
nr:hypothetical protein [Burkholderia thailandensis]